MSNIFEDAFDAYAKMLAQVQQLQTLIQQKDAAIKELQVEVRRLSSARKPE